MPGPIRPSEVAANREASIPEAVFDVFNELIQNSWDGSSATVSQNAAAAKVAEALNISRGEVFELHYLDVEAHYRKAGWTVMYDKPAYCESYEATFKFTKRKGKG